MTPAASPDIAGTRDRARPASASTSGGRQPGDERPGHPDRNHGSLLAAATALASASGTARQGGMDAQAALAAIAAARSLAAGLEHGELAFINAARSGGATWSQIAVAMGARNRQTAQKRHADLERRYTRPPSADIPAPPEPLRQETANGNRPVSTTAPGPRELSAGPGRQAARGHGNGRPVPSPAPADAAGPAVPAARSQREQPLPAITSATIGKSQYKLVRAPGHHETRAWHVLAGGTRVGLVRPTWRGERSRPGWEPVDNTGLALPATGIGRVTTAGNAPTRAAAAVSLLRALQRQQENDRKRKPRR